MLTYAILDELKRSIRTVAGEERAGEVLFRLGRMIGMDRPPATGDLTRQLERGLAQLADLGIAGVELEDIDPDPEAFRLVASITVPAAHSGGAEAVACGSAGPAEGATCGMVAGYVTGLAATLTGLDLVSDWLECPTACGEATGDEACCRFTVRSAHLGPPRSADGTPQSTSLMPQGSAHFFLGELGASLGHESISLGDFLQGEMFVGSLFGARLALL